jgi:hypothetical protein
MMSRVIVVAVISGKQLAQAIHILEASVENDVWSQGRMFF